MRYAIYSRDTAIRIYSVPRFTYKLFFVKISSWAKVMGASIYFYRPNHFDFWPNITISQAKPYVAAPGVGLACMPMGTHA